MAFPIGPAFVAFSVAAATAGGELLLTQFRNTVFTVWRSRPFLTFITIYGVIAGLVMCALQVVYGATSLAFRGGYVIPVYLAAILLGLALKMVLDLKLTSAQIGSEQIPIGLKTLVLAFESPLIASMRWAEFNGVQRYIGRFAARHTDVAKVKELIRANVPAKLEANVTDAFLTRLERADSTPKAIALYLEFGGRDSVERVFGESPSQSRSVGQLPRLVDASPAPQTEG
ncbi:MAG TPA: hypothetical protein VFN10_11710 [Thermoanaerobaculia bacterium]|nr:hypothetical protein [Thermoanaerobaculia bacterium]